MFKAVSRPICGRNYGGFDRENWTIRTNDQHRLEMQEINTCSSIGDKNELESKLGTLYSVLVQLPFIILSECLLLTICTIYFKVTLFAPLKEYLYMVVMLISFFITCVRYGSPLWP